MKAVAIAVGAIFTALAPAAFAQSYGAGDARNWDQRDEPRYDQRYDDRQYRDSARVIESRPMYTSESKRECWNPRAGHFEEVRSENHSRIGKGAAIGGVVGGVLGHQVDSGGGTAAGAILGGLLGHHLERRNNDDAQTDLDFSRCRVLSAGSGDIQGYEVRYAYNGREYVTRMNQDPGRRLRLGREINTDGTPY